MRIEVEHPLEVVKEAFWLAWLSSACLGMGMLRNNPSANKEMVWKIIVNKEDYPYHPSRENDNEAYADYVFGRMMKLGLKWDDTSVSFNNNSPREDYQSWCRIYPTTESLISQAIKNLKALEAVHQR